MVTIGNLHQACWTERKAINPSLGTTTFAAGCTEATTLGPYINNVGRSSKSLHLASRGQCKTSYNLFNLNILRPRQRVLSEACMRPWVWRAEWTSPFKAHLQHLMRHMTQHWRRGDSDVDKHIHRFGLSLWDHGDHWQSPPSNFILRLVVQMTFSQYTRQNS
jgi:hypothetical protein